MKILKIKLSKPNEWGNFIHPETLEIKEIVGEIPEKAIVIIRKKEYRSELSRSVVSTRYGVVSKGTLLYLTKKDISKKLAKLFVNYTHKHEKIPPKVTISEKRVDNKPVEITYNYSTNESFQFLLSEELLAGENPKKFIEKIITTSDNLFSKKESSKQWRVDNAPHGRSLCKKCKRQIRVSELNLREIKEKDDPSTTEFYHFSCFPFTKYDQFSIHGIKSLSEEDQRKVRKKIEK